MLPPLLAAEAPKSLDLLLTALPLLAGAGAVYLLLPRPRPYPTLWGALLAAVALVLGGVLLIRTRTLAPEPLLFYAFSAFAVISGGLLVTQHNPARAALSFALVVLSVCGLFLLLAAPFLMAASIIIYAGAIIVTFLFVIMLAQQSGLGDADARSREPLLASVTGFVLLGALLYVLRLGYGDDTTRLDEFLGRLREASAQSEPKQIDQALRRTSNRLDELTDKLEKAQGKAKADAMAAELGTPREFFAAFEKALREEAGVRDEARDDDAARENPLWLSYANSFQSAREKWEKTNAAEDEKKRALKELESLAREVKLTPFKKLQADLGRMGLRDLSERIDSMEDGMGKWQAGLKNGDAARMKEVLSRFKEIALQARQRVGLSRPGGEGGLSPLSGPPASAPDQIRRDEDGRPVLPAENAAFLGRSLFTDFLLPVELGGVLLLVATVGAIAIAYRRSQPETPEGPP
jgi:NADH:ubiquinone oxidoreductase subunit 6 (subunit J)